MVKVYLSISFWNRPNGWSPWQRYDKSFNYRRCIWYHIIYLFLLISKLHNVCCNSSLNFYIYTTFKASGITILKSWYLNQLLENKQNTFQQNTTAECSFRLSISPSNRYCRRGKFSIIWSVSTIATKGIGNASTNSFLHLLYVMEARNGLPDSVPLYVF